MDFIISRKDSFTPLSLFESAKFRVFRARMLRTLLSLIRALAFIDIHLTHMRAYTSMPSLIDALCIFLCLVNHSPPVSFLNLFYYIKLFCIFFFFLLF